MISLKEWLSDEIKNPSYKSDLLSFLGSKELKNRVFINDDYFNLERFLIPYKQAYIESDIKILNKYLLMSIEDLISKDDANEILNLVKTCEWVKANDFLSDKKVQDNKISTAEILSYNANRIFYIDEVTYPNSKLDAFFKSKLWKRLYNRVSCIFKQVNNQNSSIGVKFKRYVESEDVGINPHIDTTNATLVLYLNDVEEGGETVFPCMDIAFKPEAGQAICFINKHLCLKDDMKILVNPYMLHGAYPLKGYKYIIQFMSSDSTTVPYYININVPTCAKDEDKIFKKSGKKRLRAYDPTESEDIKIFKREHLDQCFNNWDDINTLTFNFKLENEIYKGIKYDDNNYILEKFLNLDTCKELIDELKNEDWALNTKDILFCECNELIEVVKSEKIKSRLNDMANLLKVNRYSIFRNNQHLNKQEFIVRTTAKFSIEKSAIIYLSCGPKQNLQINVDSINIKAGDLIYQKNLSKSTMFCSKDAVNFPFESYVIHFTD